MVQGTDTVNGRRAVRYREVVYTNREVVDVELPVPKQAREGLPSGKGVFLTEERLQDLELGYERRLAGMKRVIANLSASREALLRLRGACADMRADLDEVLESITLLPCREQYNYTRLRDTLRDALEDTNVDEQEAEAPAAVEGAEGGDRPPREPEGGGAAS